MRHRHGPCACQARTSQARSVESLRTWIRTCEADYAFSCASMDRPGRRGDRPAVWRSRSPRSTSFCGDRCPSSTATVSVQGISAPIEIVRDADAIPHVLRDDQGRRAVRTRVRARPGSAVADGVPASHRPRPPVGDLRRRHDSAGSLSAHRRLRPRRPQRVGGDTCLGAGAGQRLRRRRQRVHLHPSRQPRCRPSFRCCGSSPSRGADRTSSSG